VNLKPWQIFIFTLVPLAIAFAGVIGGSIHGADSAKEDFSRTSPPPPSSSTGGPAPAPGSAVIELVARNQAFDKRSITAAPNAPVVIRVNNQDAGVLHSISVYRSKSATTQPLVSGSKGDLFTGPAVQQISFTAPAAGT